MNSPQKNNPLHGFTLEQIVQELQQHYGWEELAQRIRINCFYENPSVSSSLKFLRKTPWARTKVEDLFVQMKQTEN
ncbi:MAG TPA: VF530 family protein [Flavobacteriales bacterium]|nr:VF530 family protein [Flavobacteriales bacterium]